MKLLREYQSQLLYLVKMEQFSCPDGKIRCIIWILVRIMVIHRDAVTFLTLVYRTKKNPSSQVLKNGKYGYDSSECKVGENDEVLNTSLSLEIF